jgi:RNA polymerase sigma-70 factor (ECF subfamily)
MGSDPTAARTRRLRSAPPPAAPSLTPIDTLDGLVERAVVGERAALEDVLRVVKPLIVRYCASRLGRRSGTAGDVEDTAQEVLLAVLQALPRYQDQGRPFLAFVYGIAAHKVADAWRRSGSRPDPAEAPDDQADTADGPEMLALRREGHPDLVRSIDALPARQREILRLRIVVGLSADETASAVGSTPGAVRVAQHRALGRLRTVLASAERPVSGPTGDTELDALLADAEAALGELG